MENITLDYSQVLSILSESELTSMQDEVSCAHEMLMSASGAGSDYLGWVNLPTNHDTAELDRIKKKQQKKFKRLQKY